MKRLQVLIFLIAGLNGFLSAQKDTLSVTLESIKYPARVKYLNLAAEGQDVRMAYMDEGPAGGKVVMLLHGKNFGGYYWGKVMKALTEKGFRVIVPDQVGFGKSSKPFLNYSLHQLAAWNKLLLDSLGIDRASILGHSMGGMLAARFTLMYPGRVEKLLLENPIGFEDYKTFVPYTTTEQQYKKELQATEESIRKYYKSYFPVWKQEYEWLVQIAAGMTKSSDFPRAAKVAAQTYTMIYEQPVVYEFPNIKVPSILLIGQEDRTIVGKALLSETEKLQHGQYKLLGKQVTEAIPGARLIPFEGVGHIPHIEIPEKFIKALMEALN